MTNLVRPNDEERERLWDATLKEIVAIDESIDDIRATPGHASCKVTRVFLEDLEERRERKIARLHSI